MEFISVGQHASGFIAIGQHATGFIAIGQEATGFIAVGQVATGVFALGQLARGGVVVGQLAIGLVSVGMLGVGLFNTFAMIGVAARGSGVVLSLVPASRPHAGAPPLSPARRRMDQGRQGWSPVSLVRRGTGELEVHDARGRLDLRLAASLRLLADRAVEGGSTRFLGRLRAVEGGWVVDKLSERPVQNRRTIGWAISLVPRFAMLLVLAFFVVVVGLLPIWQAMGSPVLRL